MQNQLSSSGAPEPGTAEPTSPANAGSTGPTQPQDPTAADAANPANPAGNSAAASSDSADSAWPQDPAAADAVNPANPGPGPGQPAWPQAADPAAQPPALPRFWRLSRLGRQSIYLLCTMPIATFVFCLLVTLISVGVGTIIIWVGVPLLVITLQLAQGIATFERARLRKAGYAIADPPRAAPAPAGARIKTWLKRAFLSGASWRAVAHSMLAFPLSIFTFTMTVAWWSLAIFGLTEWIWRPVVPYDACFATIGYCGDGGYRTVVDYLHLPISQTVFDLVVGLFAAVTLIPLIHAMASMHSGLARAFLTPSQSEMEQRIQELTESRAGAAQAQTNELRRLERDIHDGPQQRLIRVGMDLAAAQRRLAAGDQVAAENLIVQARQMSEDAVAELRALSRGIAPPILADRGLAVALEAVLATSVVPATMELAIPPGLRLPASVETVLYFTVTEALANAAKHAEARHAIVRLRVADGLAHLEVHDDGRGGATITPGHGLANLTARASALDGRCQVTSVEGQGTCVEVEVPISEGGVG